MAREKEKLVRADAQIPETVRDEFIGILPVFGASSWLIRLAYEAAIEELRDDPDLTERIKRAIRNKIRAAA